MVYPQPKQSELLPKLSNTPVNVECKTEKTKSEVQMYMKMKGGGEETEQIISMTAKCVHREQLK